MKLLTTISLVCILVFSCVAVIFPTYAISQSEMLVWGGENSANASTNVTVKDNFLKTIERYMIGLLGIITVSVFLFIWYNLFTAKGDPEAFKKAWIALIYAGVGLAVMPLAYIVVKIVTGFTF
ncbi:MAG: hypothetical protein ACD_78C00174G0003 [uncultured bacterium (gcode 4)]|uniref:Uncharacterized protein n=1 Tax=uncultured bacterium (gcode 4) TaxID=1234023 RepID=K1YXE1_9BACT|nr:MAG: hypothetical protein ACD_78C00174G0003 [uncultured bacterium (gcode 4)]